MAEATSEISGVDDAFPLNAAQLGMLFHTLAEPESGVYVGVLDAVLPADFDKARFKQAWDMVIARHDALRSIVVWEGVDEPLQVVRSTCDVVWEDLGADLPVVNGGLSRAYVETYRKTGIDLSSEPAMRFAFGRLSTGERCFLWSCHHALIDDWSQALVLAEVQETYRALESGDAPTQDYGMAIGEFADWLATRNKESDEGFWRQIFAGTDAPTRLQFSPPSAAAASDMLRAQVDLKLDQTQSTRLKTAANEARVTLAAFAAGIWSVVLHGLCQSNDVSYGMAATLRPPELPGIDEAIGNFVTTLPAHSKLNDHDTLRSVIHAQQEFVQDAQPRSDIALSKIQEFSGLDRDSALFDTILSVKQDALSALESDTPLFDNPAIQFKSNFALAVVFMPGPQIGLRAIFDPRRLRQADAELTLSCFAAALANAAENLDAEPKSLRLYTDQEIQAKRSQLAGPDLPPFDNVVASVRSAAAAHPGKAALTSSDKSLSYAELASAIDAMAFRLFELGLKKGDRVGLYFDRSIDVPVAMLGCMAAGLTYVPFDAAFPEKRLDRMINAAGLSAIITTDDHKAHLAGKAKTLLSYQDLIAPSDKANFDVALEDDDIAYVMFTSGSTGEPKGVEISHRNLGASTAARSVWYDEAPENYLLLSSHAFDSSVAGLYWTLCTGGSLFIPDADQARTIATLAQMFEDWKITHSLCLPSVYKLLLETSASSLTHLKTVIVAGEATTDNLLSAHRDSGLKAGLFNEYGPTEATVWSTVADLRDLRESDEIPIGRPIAGTSLKVVDAEGRDVAPGLIGELWVGGDGVAKGYASNPGETESRFVTGQDGTRFYRTGDNVRQMQDGQLAYLGRTDGQVKIRGYRVELSEIEAALASHPDVQEAAVTIFGNGASAWLAGFVQPKEDANLSPADLEKTCRDALPDFMVPRRYVLLNQMPRTPNGKVDRKALPEPRLEGADTVRVAPSTPTEAVLAEIWRKALWLDHAIGTTENFFDLGGHSLIAIKLLNDIHDTFGISVPASSIGKITTIAEQAKLIEVERRKGATPEVTETTGRTPEMFKGLSDIDEAKLAAAVSSWKAPPAKEGMKTRILNAAGTKQPLFFFFLDEYSCMQLAEALGPDQPVYGIRCSNDVIPLKGEEGAEVNMRRTALTYLPEVLELAGDEPILMGGYCQGATIAMNVAAQLIALQKQVATLISVEKTPPLQYPGHVDIVFADRSFLNPYNQYDKPEMAWSRRYASHSYTSVPGDYIEVFRPQYVDAFAATIRKQLAEATDRSMAALPRSARALEWVDAPAVGNMYPGDNQLVRITVKNCGSAAWSSTSESGLRLKAGWYSETGNALAEAVQYAVFSNATKPGATAEIELRVTAPTDVGRYELRLDVVEEGVAHFSKMGNDELVLPVAVLEDAERNNAVAASLGNDDPLQEMATAMANATGSAVATQQNTPRDLVPTTAALASSLHDLGQLHLRAGDLSAATRALSSALELDPKNGAAILSLARVRLAQKRFIDAHRLIGQALRRDPSMAREARAFRKLHLSPSALAKSLRNKVLKRQPKKNLRRY